MNAGAKNHYSLANGPFSSVTPKSVHFIGVLGIGISSLAQWFLAQKWAVSGSDAALSHTYPMLQKAGLKAKIGHKKANLPRKCGLVVYSQAIKPDNPELKEARRKKLAVLSYPDAIGELTKFYETISISGMHGKSTTTALTGLMLVKAGFDPTIIVGTRLKEFGNRNFRAGRGKHLVVESDEYKDAFLKYSPALSITTNLDKEHLDYFKNAERIKKSFLKFFSKTRRGLILNRDSRMLFSLNRKIKKICSNGDLGIKWYSLRDKEAAMVKKHIKLPGEHNASNALAVFCLSKFLGIDKKFFISTVSKYGGAWRRMEYRGKYQVSGIKYQVSRNKNKNRKYLLQNTRYQIPVYDDYAHHPTEIKATLAAFREKFPRSEILCVFQPHQAERLKLLFHDFKTAFDGADKTLIMPIYKVAGREKQSDSKYSSEALVESIQKVKPARKVFYLKEPKNIKKALEVLLSNRSFPCPRRQACPLLRKSAPTLSSGPRKSALSLRRSAVIVMMGAGDIVNYTDSLIK